MCVREREREERERERERERESEREREDTYHVLLTVYPSRTGSTGPVSFALGFEQLMW